MSDNRKYWIKNGRYYTKCDECHRQIEINHYENIHECPHPDCDGMTVCTVDDRNKPEPGPAPGPETETRPIPTPESENRGTGDGETRPIPIPESENRGTGDGETRPIPTPESEKRRNGEGVTARPNLQIVGAVREPPEKRDSKTKRKRYRWTPEEDQILRDYYPKEGIFAVMANLGNKRDQRAVGMRIFKLGLRKEKSDQWTTEEIQLLRDIYPTQGIDVVYKVLNGKRTINAIRMQLSSQKIHSEKIKNKSRHSEQTQDQLAQAINDLSRQIEKFGESLAAIAASRRKHFRIF